MIKIKKIFFNFLKFIILKKKFQKNKKKILILHKSGSEYFLRLFKKKEVEIVDYINEVNTYILLYLIFKKKNLFNYFFYYLKIYFPTYIISFIDNNETLYELKNFFTKKKFIFIQNGYRRKNHINFKKKNLSADLICVFGNKNHSLYKKVKSKILTIGSFKNNFFKIDLKKKNKEIYYISQFRNNKETDKIYKFNNKMIN